MNIELLIDMNLSPEWVAELARHGYNAIHWSTIGNGHAPDTEIMAWARANHRVVFTHDLDFGTLLALTHANGPSVLQIRGQNTLPEHMSPLVLAALRQYSAELYAGSMVVVEENKSRARVLPI
jgi:predicted nuclease of predicted toxin-antitoxin system